eukprot:7380163-Prymnesium_polylepis.2
MATAAVGSRIVPASGHSDDAVSMRASCARAVCGIRASKATHLNVRHIVVWLTGVRIADGNYVVIGAVDEEALGRVVVRVAAAALELAARDDAVTTDVDVPNAPVLVLKPTVNPRVRRDVVPLIREEQIRRDVARVARVAIGAAAARVGRGGSQERRAACWDRRDLVHTRLEVESALAKRGRRRFTNPDDAHVRVVGRRPVRDHRVREESERVRDGH